MLSPSLLNKTRLLLAGEFFSFSFVSSIFVVWSTQTTHYANFTRLVNVLKAANQHVPEDLMKFGTTVKKKQHDAYGAFFKDVDTDKKATKITFDD